MGSIRENNANSRLVTNSEKIRENLTARNLYGIDGEYPVTTNSVSNKIIQSVNAISQFVTPYSGFDLSNTVFGRAIEDRTALTEIGLVMLGKQFAMNAMKRAANEVIPIIKPANLLPWRDGELVQSRINWRVTRDETRSNFQNFLETAIHFYPNSKNPFNKYSTNLDYIRNTGKAQLNQLYGNINNNLFTSQQIISVAGDDVPTRAQNLTPNKVYFTKSGARGREFYPYVMEDYTNLLLWEETANKAMRKALEYDSDAYPEYGSDLYFIENQLGITQTQSDIEYETALNQENDKFINEWISETSGFINESEANTNKIVWGRDGITEETDTQLSKANARGDSIESFGDTSFELDNRFNVRSGLLEYTRNLVNASGGQVGDITRKVFKKGDKIVGFNGSPLWKAPSTALERFRNKAGVRQHTVLDQYGGFAKAIRFDGNEVYGGNPDSVIYKSVLPKIHPIINEENQVDVRNMMFSIENLAVGIIDSGERFGTIDDEYGTKIPATEVGQFGGRVMWFPPYNLEFTETSAANFESTVMVGRNEPMYNYLHSERAGTIRFSLIIDYPPQLKNFKGENRSKEIAEFFAFGGEGPKPEFIDKDRLIPRIREIERELGPLNPQPQIIEPDIPEDSTIRVSFPNDIPKLNDTDSTTVFDDMYKLPYEIYDGIISVDGTGFGINQKVFYPQGIEMVNGELQFDKNVVSISQYNYNPLDNTPPIPDFSPDIGFEGITELDRVLLDSFENEENRRLLKITIDGGASKLFFDTFREAEYNFELGKRRARATRNLVNARLKTLFGKTAQELGIQFDLGGVDGTGSFGSQNALEENATTDRIPAEDTKNERYAEISITRTDVTPEPVIVELTPEQIKRKETLELELESINRKLARLRSLHSGEVYNLRTAGDEEENIDDSGKAKGFEYISKNYFAPVFHSQTPEDFHRRLTFLHQCTRQGSAKRYDTEVDATGVPRMRNSVFGKQPICVLRIGDHFFTKIIIENLTIDYNEFPWDTNPEGFGMQPMLADITLNIKIIGGQSLKGPIDALQNAVSFNYYANSTFSDDDVYATASYVAALQEAYRMGVDDLRDGEGNLKSYEEVLELIEVKRNSE